MFRRTNQNDDKLNGRDIPIDQEQKGGTREFLIPDAIDLGKSSMTGFELKRQNERPPGRTLALGTNANLSA